MHGSKEMPQMAFKKVVVGVVAAMVAVAVGCVVYDYKFSKNDTLRIYGSVDMRTVDLAFEEAGRIDALFFEEGAAVKAGDVLARLDDTRYRIASQNAQAQASVAQKQLDLLLAGARQEDIDAAKANVAAAQASETLAQRTCARETRLGEASSIQRRDQACSEARVAKAQRQAAQKQLDLLLAGTRIEEIDVAKAQVVLSQSVCAEADRALKQTTLTAPVDGVIRARHKEKGDMVSASVPVYELAVMNPVWVRAWVDEINLGKVELGKKVKIVVDSYPEKSIEGAVGFVSTVAEFTPKTVQTEDLRTALVYEVRVTAADPEGLLRLGMPATVVFPD